MKVSVCSTCDSPIIWTITGNGNRMPVDAHPVENGNLRLEEHGGEVHATVEKVGTPAVTTLFDGPDDGPRYVSHFVTCPQATQHRHPTS